MNAPNVWTAVRIALVPVLIIALVSSFKNHEFVALGIFLLATFTDTMDGFLARRKKKITTLGQLLDPIADKLLMTSAFICLVESGAVASWMAIIIIGREIAITGLRAIAASQGVSIRASWPGKIKMILQTITVPFLILGEKILGKFALVGRIGLWLVMATAVYSAAEYIIKFGPRLLLQRSDD
jgi:CDP-diacylglycerol--glycerol-3-phosphate 3-phosphatidyltransferase